MGGHPDFAQFESVVQPLKLKTGNDEVVILGDTEKDPQALTRNRRQGKKRPIERRQAAMNLTQVRL
jgi:hypothetical protein